MCQAKFYRGARTLARGVRVQPGQVPCGDGAPIDGPLPRATTAPRSHHSRPVIPLFRQPHALWRRARLPERHFRAVRPVEPALPFQRHWEPRHEEGQRVLAAWTVREGCWLPYQGSHLRIERVRA
jgi:hypothetical protein